MATIKIRWNVAELVNVMSLFDVQKVYRSTTGISGSYAEITSVATRVPLVVETQDYLYDDAAGDASYFYKVSYFNSVNFDESSLSDPISGDMSGYCTIQDIRDEGFSEAAVSDARVVEAIELATAMIDRVTMQWFEPRTRVFTLDHKRQSDRFLLDVPIITLNSVEVDGTELVLSDLAIYNRHLTQGLLNPDDRAHPHMSVRELDPSEQLYPLFGRPFMRGRQVVKVDGIFGYTELAPNDPVGETSEGSQVPLSYGRTPILISRACKLLTVRYMPTIASGDGDDFANRGKIKSEKTKDQSYEMFQTTGAVAADDGATGDPEVDAILASFMGPMRLGSV